MPSHESHKPAQEKPDEQTLVLNALFALMARQNQELRHKATHDPLTGLLNRQGLEEVLSKNQPPRAMLHADSTNLKKVNDSLGHDRGDEAIIATAKVLQASLRPDDVVARVGGDEFLVLLDPQRRESTESQTSQELLDAVKSRIGEEASDLLGRPENSDLAIVGFDVAVGGAVWEEGMSIDTLRANSDADMYRVKESQHTANGDTPR